MRLLDRYIAKQLVLPIVFCTSALIFLVFIADLFDNLEEMLRHKTSIFHILTYYALTTPQAFVDTVSWACLLAIIYVLTTFNYHNELTAMKVSGLEITSIIRPILFIGLVIGIFTFIISDRVLPVTNHKAVNLLEKHIEGKKEFKDREIFKNVTYFGGGNRLYFAQSFDPEMKQMDDFIVLWLDKNKNVKRKTIAQRALWTGSAWELSQATDYMMESSNEMIGEPVFNKSIIYKEIKESPDEFLKAAMESASISYRDLKDYIHKMKENGIKIDSETVELHYKLAAPWQSLIVMFLTIPILGKTTTRRTIAWSVLVCLVVVFMYHITGAVMLALGKAGKIFPVASAWFHNVVFGGGAFFFLERAND